MDTHTLGLGLMCLSLGGLFGMAFLAILLNQKNHADSEAKK